VEYIDNEALSRGTQRQVAQDLIDGDPTAIPPVPGIPEVGQDAPFGDAPFVQSWGRPETSGLRFFVNSGFDISDRAELYARFGYADTEGRYRFFYRAPDHATFTGAITEGEDFSPLFIACPVCTPGSGEQMSMIDMGWTGLPGGFTPVLTGEQTDASIVLGVQGEYESGMLYDFSFGFGKNELAYFLNNTSNRSLGPGTMNAAGGFDTLPQMNFDNGGYEQKELMVNADFSVPMSDSLNLGFGAEWREETYTAIAGEPASFFIEGASGLKGVTTDDAVASARDNVALYADLEHDISDALLLQYALRYEDFSDFGDTINWKVAGRYRFSDGFAIRGAVSTGFHAPTPGQANVRTTITTADSLTGLLVEEGLLPPTSDAAVAVGGTALKEEESLNLSVGFTADFGSNTTLTLDVYKIEVDDRIYKTGNIPDPATGGSIAFYTNALDVEHTGVDLVLTSGWDWSASASSDLTVAFAYNEVEVTGQTAVNSPTGPILPVSDANIEYIENNYPNERAVVTLNNHFGDNLSFLVRANYYGKHFDERGRMGDTTGDASWEIGATVYFDLDLGYQINDNWRVNLGGINVFDEFVDVIPDDGIHANRQSVGLPYPRRSAANYEGGQFYLRGTFSF
jgi:iron complex outermembrane receptor protein